MIHQPTLYIELVDRADDRSPTVLSRMPVWIRVDRDPANAVVVADVTAYRVDSGDVGDDLRLGLGDVIVACDSADAIHSCNTYEMWLAEVVAAGESFYMVARLGPTTLTEWIHRNDDPRWRPARRPAA